VEEAKAQNAFSEEGQTILTPRKRIAEALEEECLDVREISKRFGIKEKEVIDHLNHIAKSVHPKHLFAEPAACNQCGFSFKKRSRLSTPGRCPVCRSEHISPPRFRIDSSTKAKKQADS
jgi:transcriptional regulator